MAKSYIRRSKFSALITYCLVVLILFAGLILPLGTGYLKDAILNFEPSKEFFEQLLKQIPLMQVTGAFDSILNSLNINLDISSKLGSFYAYPEMYTYGISLGGKVFDIGSILLFGYIFIALLSVVMFLPVAISKRWKSTALKSAISVEILSLMVLGVMFGLDLFKHSIGIFDIANWNLGIVLPFILIFAILVLQSLIYYGPSALIKTVVALISCLAILLSLFSIVGIIPQLAEPTEKFLDLISFSPPFAHTLGLYNGVYGIYPIIYFLDDARTLVVSGEILKTLTNFSALLLVLIVIINFYFDICDIGKRANISAHVFNILRYLLEILLVIALAFFVFFADGNFGLILYVLLLLACTQVVISVGRLIYAIVAAAVAKKRRIRESLSSAVETEEHVLIGHDGSQPPEETNATPAKEVTEETKNDETPAEAIAEAPATAIEEVAVEPAPLPEEQQSGYNGPLDKFIRKLTDEEKVEFLQVFIERSKGKLAGIPEYEVAGDNARFFSSVFIYIARVRDIVSDGLMNKLYEEVNLMN